MAPSVHQILQTLREQGYKRTPQRERIVEILWESRAPMTAREVYDAVKEEFPHVSLDTVYRNLDLLRKAGLASQINLQNRESARFELHHDGEHHHHVVCLDCGKAVCLPVCPLDSHTLDTARKRDFTLVGHAFELYGYCDRCRA